MMCSAVALCPLNISGSHSFDKDECPIYEPSNFRPADIWRAESFPIPRLDLLFSSLNRTSTVSVVHSNAVDARSCLLRNRESRLNLLSLLPVEISIRILKLVSPQDLCRLCLVCKYWYALCQDKVLWMKRKSYVKQQRAHFRLDKENITFTPQHNTVIRQHSTPLLSPRNMVNSHNKPQLSLPSSPSHSSHHYTPGPSFSAMVEDVGRLNIDTRSSDIDVRRCLFPMSESPTINTKGLAQLNICGTFEVQQNVDLKSSTSWLVGKKANRSRLRRL